jgi:molybdopterin biosynthesis enzyme
MKKIATKDAVGHVLCHDITRIVKDVEKDVAFRKGHIVRPEDIEALHSLGKFHLYVWEKRAGMLHEDEAADILRAACQNAGMTPTPVKEGKIELIAQRDGLFRVDAERLLAINSLGEISIAARHTNTPVAKGETLAGVRVTPLTIAREKMDQVGKLAGATPILELLPYKPLRAGIVTTGREVAEGLIQDTFTPVVAEKLAHFGMTVMGHEIVDDRKENIARAILRHREAGAELILCTGGMSVDPDDRTPGAIMDSGAKPVCYGAPVLPGAMFLLAYFEDGTPVLGLPGCVMYEKRTIFDIVLPRVAAGVAMTARDFAALGHGGLCLKCEKCRYPACGFGKGN